MLLERDEAVALAPALSKAVRSYVSGKVLSGPERFAGYVRRACEVARARGAWVDEAGRFHVDEPDPVPVSPEESAARALRIARGRDARAMVTALDRAMQDVLSTAERAQALVATAYDEGLALSVELVEATRGTS